MTMQELAKPLPVSDPEFRLFQRLVYESAGIFLAPVKRALLSARLSRRIRQLGLASFGEYYDHVLNSGDDERRLLLDCICTNETHFFREPAQFDYLEQVVIPGWLEDPEHPKSVRVWSAACSTGEEPFSIAMLLHHRLTGAGWSAKIVATDLSTRALERAQNAEWPVDRAEEIPAPYLRRYMLKGRRSKEGLMKAAPDIRSMVELARLNLNEPPYPISGRFDVIFCRNVLIYFDAASKQRVFDQLIQHLVPGGYLFLGHAESGSGWNDELVPVKPAICHYRPRGAAA